MTRKVKIEGREETTSEVDEGSEKKLPFSEPAEIKLPSSFKTGTPRPVVPKCKG